MNSRRLAVLAAPLAAAATILVPATAAQATTGADYTAGGANIRSGPHLTSGILGVGTQGQGASIYCWVTGDSVSGDSTWLYNRDDATGVTGYSPQSYLSWSGSVPRC